MSNVTELRVALTVEDFDRAVAFYRDALGLEQIADWSSATGKVVVLEAGGGTLGVFDHAPAETGGAMEAGGGGGGGGGGGAGRGGGGGGERGGGGGRGGRGGGGA